MIFLIGIPEDNRADGLWLMWTKCSRYVVCKIQSRIYGHDHSRNICKGAKLYINVGSLGCPSGDRNIARAGVLTIENGKAGIETIDVVYNVDEVIHQIDMIHYPDADNIKKYFYGL